MFFKYLTNYSTSRCHVRSNTIIFLAAFRDTFIDWRINNNPLVSRLVLSEKSLDFMKIMELPSVVRLFLMQLIIGDILSLYYTQLSIRGMNWYNGIGMIPIKREAKIKRNRNEKLYSYYQHKKAKFWPRGGLEALSHSLSSFSSSFLNTSVLLS